jgi:hypothetical protein
MFEEWVLAGNPETTYRGKFQGIAIHTKRKRLSYLSYWLVSLYSMLSDGCGHDWETYGSIQAVRLFARPTMGLLTFWTVRFSSIILTLSGQGRLLSGGLGTGMS